MINQPIKVLAIIGSSRLQGNSSQLVQMATKQLTKMGIIVDTISLADYQIKDCCGCEGCHKSHRCVIKDDMQSIYPLIDQADGLILASPTYFYNVTALMKAFIDRLYCYQVFDDDDRSVWTSVNELAGNYKLAMTIAVSEQEKEVDMGYTATAMSLPLQGLGYRVVSEVKVLHCFKPQSVPMKTNEQVSEATTKLGKLLIKKENYHGRNN